MVDTVALHYTEQGAGPPLVLLHGFPLSSAIWREQHRQLSKQFRVITPDLRGHGGSPAPEGVYEMDLLARDVLALLDTLNIRQAAFMGHSMGGYVTLAAWKRAPERFLALGLISSQAGADTEEGRQGRFKLADKVAADGSKVAADAMLPKLFAPGLATDSPLVSLVRELIVHTSPTGIIGSLKGMAARPDSGPELANIHIPALIVAGEKDQIIPAEKAKAIAGAIAKSTWTPIANAGHMPMLEQPEATTNAIADFMQTIPPVQP